MGNNSNSNNRNIKSSNMSIRIHSSNRISSNNNNNLTNLNNNIQWCKRSNQINNNISRYIINNNNNNNNNIIQFNSIQKINNSRNYSHNLQIYNHPNYQTNRYNNNNNNNNHNQINNNQINSCINHLRKHNNSTIHKIEAIIQRSSSSNSNLSSINKYIICNNTSKFHLNNLSNLNNLNNLSSHQHITNNKISNCRIHIFNNNNNNSLSSSLSSNSIQRSSHCNNPKFSQQRNKINFLITIRLLIRNNRFHLSLNLNLSLNLSLSLSLGLNNKNN